MNLEGKLVYIRPLNVSDARALHQLRNDNRTFFMPYEPVQPEEAFTLESIRASIEQGHRDEAEGKGYAFGIFENGTHQIVGRVRLSNIVRGAWHNATVGYFTAGPVNGRGYMTEALRLTLQFAFEQALLHRVQAAVMPRNTGSIRVVEKNGMRFEGLAERYLKINGVWEDHRIYALTAEEWKP
ncbi:GNAT family protein [Paenibacillus filicis]|uniref:GNAT family protein n=1 Tax=Paenibacillus gyeongsangnamensis TaxID=3388067 RepID=A0ABT4Q396_9BACL|nr:GNAT family protein [Paenibacillus filicis]MCZ8511344.1 GNAT family protein [Paenibacillus filicis]